LYNTSTKREKLRVWERKIEVKRERKRDARKRKEGLGEDA
jgi:hypothetical protein